MSMFSALRPMAEQFMSDRCTINRPASIEYDAQFGYEVDTAGDEVYSGKCQVRPFGGGSVVEAGEGPRSLSVFTVRLPWDTTGIEIDHVVTITASSDPYMVDRELRVMDVQGGTESPTRTLICEDTLTVSGGS